MLRSHHQAYKLYMRHKLRVSMYGFGRALVCGILGGGHLPRVVLVLVLGGGSGWWISRPERFTCLALEVCRIDIVLLVLVLLWCWKLRVTLARPCIVTGDYCRIGVLSVVVTVVMGSACGTNTVLSCMWESLFNRHSLFVVFWDHTTRTITEVNA